MTELELKYGCNPNQKPARLYMAEGELPLQVLNGRPTEHEYVDLFDQVEQSHIESRKTSYKVQQRRNKKQNSHNL